jgi:amidohydrolase
VNAYRLSSELIAEAVAWRHHLHQHPELAYSEHWTSDFIATELERNGLRVHRGLAGTGVVGTLSGGTSKRAIGIRADMDALRIQEQGAASHASCIPGLMHACGHDGHVAIALAAARACAQLENLDGTVHFIFQPAEEGGAGARLMIEQGLFRLFPCEAVYALHNWPALPFGTCAALDGAMMAANAVIEIEIRGRGCHGAMPHEGTDCVLAGCYLVSALQSIVSRNVDPLDSAVISVTQIRAGDTHNVVPDTCRIRGTARWFDTAVGERIEHRLGEVARSAAAAFGCDARVSFERRYPATINDAKAAALVRSVASSIAGVQVVDARPTTGSEDFSFMLQAVRGCYLWLGAGRRDGADHGLHSPHYDFNDDLIPTGVALWVELVRKSLGQR